MFRSLYQPVLSCLRSGFDVWPNQFGSVAGSIQSGKFRFCFLWRQVQAGRASEATSGNGCSTLFVCIFPFLCAEMLMFPNTGALLTGELTPVWSHSWMQIERTDFSTCTTTNSDLLYHHLCVWARELHSFTPTQHSKYWAVAWTQCLLRPVWGA